ncbi:hypothetical protein EV192_12821 [Actinocrispum wychmicini]|uniref:Uncharacterized protein n=1 Tax=Actinocrispum wychmicini TaxID=1213861 RepID=A0A4R2IIZ7_9PSEU|nr:hypothetical protein EV192_12821 [Actinocrispum wychmicini]
MNELEPVQRAVTPPASQGPWHSCSTPDCEYLGTDVLVEFLGDALARLYGDEEPDYGPCGGARFHYVFVSDLGVHVLCGHSVASLGSYGVAHPSVGTACGPCMEIFEHGSIGKARRGFQGAQDLERESQGLPPKNRIGEGGSKRFIVEVQYE